MTIRAKFLFSTVVTVVFVVVELGLVLALLFTQSSLYRAQNTEHISMRLANELRYSSDELTRTARTYVVTGDTKYRDEYWHILAVRDGKEPRPDGRTVRLRQLLKDAGITPDELQKLETAEDNSNALVATEVAAFQAMDGHFVPRGTVLSRNDADYTRTAPPDQAFAIRIMHDDKYHQDKAIIMQPISDFEGMVEARTVSTVNDLDWRSRVLLLWIAGVVCALVVVAIGAHYFAQIPVLRSIRVVTGELTGLARGEFNLGNRLNAGSEDEIGAISEAFNSLLEKLSSIVQDVRSQAALVIERTAEMQGLLGSLQESVEQQRESTQSTTAAARQIAATSAELRRTTDNMAGGAGKTNTSVGEGKSGIERIGSSVSALIQASEQIVSKLSVINSRVGQITTMSDAIRRVTDQTNLLSLNAGIEAVRAGEFGLGFSVVANEIRRLADQSADSTVEIDEVIREVRRSVEAGVMEMDRFRGRLNEAIADIEGIQGQLGGMISEVQQLLPMIEEVRGGFAAQDQGVQQINEAMLALNDKVNATMAALEQARVNRQLVEETGRHLQKLVGEMKTE